MRYTEQSAWVALVLGVISAAQLIGAEAFTSQWLMLTLGYTLCFLYGYCGAFLLDRGGLPLWVTYTIQREKRRERR